MSLFTFCFNVVFFYTLNEIEVTVRIPFFTAWMRVYIVVPVTLLILFNKTKKNMATCGLMRLSLASCLTSRGLCGVCVCNYEHYLKKCKGDVSVSLTRSSSSCFQRLFVSCETDSMEEALIAQWCVWLWMNREKEELFCDISAWCLWDSVLDVRALMWFSHNKEVLIQCRFLSKQMVPVCVTQILYECLSYWYCSVHICSL